MHFLEPVESVKGVPGVWPLVHFAAGVGGSGSSCSKFVEDRMGTFSGIFWVMKSTARVLALEKGWLMADGFEIV